MRRAAAQTDCSLVVHVGEFGFRGASSDSVFRVDGERKRRVIGDEPGNTNKNPDASEEAVPKGEGRADRFDA